MEDEEISVKKKLRPADAAAAASRLTEVGDLIMEILSRLPFRPVCRFKCISKPWRDLIAHPAHCKKLPQTLAGLLYATTPDMGDYWEWEQRGTSCHLAGLSAEAGGLDLDPSLTFLRPMEYRHLTLRHDCNGLLLCSYRPDKETGCLVVCNPATKRWTELPPRPQPRPDTNYEYEYLNLAFDPAVPSCFHVFDFEYTQSLGITGVSIYSLRTRAWSHRDVEWDKVLTLEHLQSVLVGGMLHIVGIESPKNSNEIWEDNDVLVAVDMEGKVCKTISVPRKFVFWWYTWVVTGVPALCCYIFSGSSHFVDYQLVGFHPDRDTFFFLSNGNFDGEAWDEASLMSWDMRRRQISSVLDLETISVGMYLPYVPIFSLEALADADGH